MDAGRGDLAQELREWRHRDEEQHRGCPGEKERLLVPTQPLAQSPAHCLSHGTIRSISDAMRA